MKSLYKKANTKYSTVADPTKPFHPVNNPDGYFPQTTKADSLALYNNALLKEKYYKDNPDYVEDKPDIYSTDFRGNSFRDRIIRQVMSPSLPVSVNPVVNQDLINDIKARAISQGKPLSGTEETAMQNKLGETRFGLVPGTNLYQFGDILYSTIDDIYNPLAPPIYLHPHIKPQGSQAYSSSKFGDRTEVPYYDPIAIAPLSILNDEQLRQRIEKYGKNSVTESIYTRLNRNQDIKPIPTLDSNVYLTSEQPTHKAQFVKNEYNPVKGKNLYIQFKDPNQSTRTSQELIRFGDWGTFSEFNDALQNAGKMFKNSSANQAKTQGSSSYGGTTKEEAMEIYKKYTTPKSSYRTGGVFKDPPPSPIPSGVNVFATSNSIYRTPNNTTANKPVEYNPVYKSLAEKNFTKQELNAINNKKPDVLKQDKSAPKPVGIPFDQIQLALDAGQFVPPIATGAYFASLPFTTYDVGKDLYESNYKQAGLDALGYIPAFKAFMYGAKGNKMLDTTSKLAKQLKKVNTITNVTNTANDANKSSYQTGGLFKKKNNNSITPNPLYKSNEDYVYNAWRKSLPENLRNESKGYNLRGAWEAGLEPEYVTDDMAFHLSSRNPNTGEILKSPGHQSYDMAIEGDIKAGYVPMIDLKTGKIYTINNSIDPLTEGPFKNVFAKGGQMIKRADGSYSQRGLWDNIRANKGSGKKPTKQMLEQEKKIKAKYSEGGITSLKDLDPKTMKKYIADLKNQENDAKKGYTNSRWYPHASVEGGSDTIAYGHKILPNEDFSKGLSDYEAEQLLQRDVLVHQANAKKQIDNKYGEGTFNSLPQDRQMLLVDYDYNLGSLSKFPNFVDAAVKGNNEKMLKEYVRYSGGKPLKKRNDWSLNVINNMSQPVYSRIPPPDNLFKHLSLPVDNLIIKKTIL